MKPWKGKEGLHQEGIRLKGIKMHPYSSSVPNYLEYQSCHHGTRETPCSVAPELKALDEEDEAKGCEVEGVTSQAWDVPDSSIV
jgi:hypothetical protein